MSQIVICGNYGATNIGDEAILAGFLSHVRARDSNLDVCVLSYIPSETECFHGVRSAYFLPFGIRSFFRGVFYGELQKTLREIKLSKFFILGGGGLFTDERLYAIFLWAWHAFIAFLYKKPVCMYAQSIGPLDTLIGRRIVSWVMKKADAISVRDEASKKLLLELGVKKEIVVHLDPAFFLEKGIDKALQFKKKSYILVILRPWIKKVVNFEEIWAQFLDQIFEKYGVKVLLLPFQRLKDDDYELLNCILFHVKNKKNVQLLNFQLHDGDFSDIFSLFRNARAVIGMRLHALIFAVMMKTPFLSLVYSPKVKQFLKEFDMEVYSCDISEITLHVLQERFEKLMKDEAQVRKCLQNGLEKIPESRKHSQEFLEEFFKSFL